MKVLFIYPNLGGSVGFNIGLAMLSAQLKRGAHETKLIHLNESLGSPLDFNNIEKTVLDYNPGLIGISVNTNQYSIGIDISRFLKSRGIDAPIVFGGIHPTLNPEKTLENPCVDFVVVGEGEGAILDLANSLERKINVFNIDNLWLKIDGKIRKNKLRKLISLENNFFMDVDLFENFKKITDLKNGWAEVILGRGCPFNCNYCFNDAYRKTYRKYGKAGDIKNYIRNGDYDVTLQGIIRMKDRFKNITCFSFVDDDFLIDRNSLEFIKRYKKEVGLPFVINTTVQSIDEEKLEALKSGGCDLLRIGIESGNENIRKEVLNRNVGNEAIIRKIRLARSKGLRVLTYNLIGLPNETREIIIETIKINLECGTDLVKMATFYPYEGTKIYSLCKEKGLINEESQETTLTYFDRSILNFDESYKADLSRMQKYFDVYLNYHDIRLMPYYREIMAKIERLPVNNLDNSEIKKEIEIISRELSYQGIEHYALKYTAFLAVKVN